MKKTELVAYTFFLLLLLNLRSNAQGCSDAGFCTINSLKPNSSETESLNNQFKLGFSLGDADKSITAYGSYLEYNRWLNDKFAFDIKLTSLAQSGNEISTFGFSDIYLNANIGISKNTRLTIGSKIPLSDAKKMKNNLPLPMDYQSSLGTFDLILGLGQSIKKLQLVAALQQPLTQNKNQFLTDSYPENSKLLKFHSTNNFKRSGDIMLRVSYPFGVGKKLKFTPGLLPIYHLSNDKYTDAMGIEKEIEGSQGLTLNGNVYLDYKLDKKSALQLNLGMPFIVRDSRPDGLTRSFIVNFEYQIRF